MKSGEIQDISAELALGDRFQTLGRLGRGGSSSVLLARDRHENESLVALKIQDIARAASEAVLERYESEGRISSELKHPNLITARETIRAGDFQILVLEYAGGGTLRDLLRKGRLEIPQCLRILAGVIEGVNAIHNAGYLHRDLKPENVLLTEDGEVKISDFGTATQMGEKPSTSQGMLIGTPKYVAPEYVSSAEFDARSDIYALGVMAYEMIVGASPFRAATAEAILVERLERRNIGVRDAMYDCPRKVADFVDKAMAIDPEDRFQDVREMARALESLLEDSSYVPGHALWEWSLSTCALFMCLVLLCQGVAKISEPAAREVVFASTESDGAGSRGSASIERVSNRPSAPESAQPDSI